MTRPLARTSDLLADATHLALVGETAEVAATRLGFDTATALLDFLRAHRYVGTARRLATNTGPTPSGTVEAFVTALTTRNPDAIADTGPTPRHARAPRRGTQAPTSSPGGAHEPVVGPPAGGQGPVV